MRETQKAWLAGIFDGEGCVWSRWPKNTNVVIEIKMTHLPTLKRINRLFPGRLVEGQLSGMSVKRQWRWTLDTNGSRKFLTMMMPYMVTKKNEAWVALKLCKRPITSRNVFDKLALMLKKCRE